jgi:NTP pyrophosphatase (non-canonical NTP hydrolase)
MPDTPDLPDTSHTSDTSASPEPITLAGLQRVIRERYHTTDAARGTPGTFMWFVEEVGELATALHKAAGQGGDTSGDDDPAGEFADVLAWLCTLANINGIDLDRAVRDKYLDGNGPTGTK